MAPSPRRYRYVGPPELRRPGADGPGDDTVIVTATSVLETWLAHRPHSEATDPHTFVIGTDGRLRLAPRRSEHVACAAGGEVLAAGEITFTCDGSVWSVVAVSNQSTGYCPDPECWPAVAAALDALAVAHPGAFTDPVVFRRCPGCGQHNIVRDQDFVCAVCGSPLPGSWNIDPGVDDAGGLRCLPGADPAVPPPASPLAAQMQVAAAVLVGRHVAAVTYHGLIGDTRDATTWDFDTWHCPVMGIELVLDDGTPFSAVWDSILGNFSLSLGCSPMTDHVIAADDTCWRVHEHPRWARLLADAVTGSTLLWHPDLTDSGQCAPAAWRLDFPQGSVWITVAMELEHRDSWWVGADEVVVIFTRELAAHVLGIYV